MRIISKMNILSRRGVPRGLKGLLCFGGGGGVKLILHIQFEFKRITVRKDYEWVFFLELISLGRMVVPFPKIVIKLTQPYL